MILISNLTKKYNSRTIFKNINLQLKSKGFYTFYGRSGCGKSTLLNCISSLDLDYEGEIIIDGQNIKQFDENKRRDFRLNYFGFVFQSFNLFTNQTVYDNLLLVSTSSNIVTKENKEHKIDEILTYLGIYDLKNEYIRNLSGGEKQRVAIARTLMNNPKIIFCDEPTGSLDKKNSEEIFKLLKRLSNNYLIICVSHDYELIKKYSDFIYYFKVNSFKENISTINDDEPLKIIKDPNKNQGKISLKYILQSIKSTFKIKKVRYLLSSIILSISLICLGVSIYINDNVSNGISKAFSSIIDDNSLILKKKNDISEIIRYGANKEDINKIIKFYEKEVDYIGARYLNNFNDFFIDYNNFFISKNGLLRNINFIKFQDLNNFTFIDIGNNNFYIEKELENDEIIISLDYKSMESLCYELEIVRSFESLENYIKEVGLKLIMKTANYNREYEDEQMFKVFKIVQSQTVKIYHTNSLFNEYLLEEMMRFPYTTNIDAEIEIPWVLKKVYYLKLHNFPTNFINEILFDERFKHYVFESDNFIYSPTTCKYGEPCYSNKIFVFKVVNNLFDYSIIKEIQRTYPNFGNYYFSSPLGYYNYGDSMLNGFSNETYFSFNEKTLDDFITKLDKISKVDFENMSFSKEILKGHVLNNNGENVKFSTKYDNFYSGNETIKYNEIVISSKIANHLQVQNVIGKDFYIIQNYEQSYDGVNYFNKFKKIKLKIAGVVDSNRYCIYQNSLFSLSLFRDFFETSSFYLIPNSVVFEFDKKPDSKIIDSINSYFYEYELIDPFLDVDKNINEVFSYFNIILLIFTLFSSISSIILLFVVNTINLEEDKKDIAILIALGFRNSQINKIELFKNFSFTFPSMISSIFSIVVLSILLKDVINNNLGLEVVYSIPVNSIIGIIILTISISLISFSFLLRSFQKRNILSDLH